MKRGEEESALVGSLLLRHEKGTDRLVLISVMVDPGFRRVGLGRRLVGWAEKIARSRSLRELLAPLEAENAAGSAFLAAQGFVPEPGSPPFFEDAAGGNLWRRPVTAAPPAPLPAQAAEAASPASGAPQPDAAQPASAPSAAPPSAAPDAPAEVAAPGAPEAASEAPPPSPATEVAAPAVAAAPAEVAAASVPTEQTAEHTAGPRAPVEASSAAPDIPAAAGAGQDAPPPETGSGRARAGKTAATRKPAAARKGRRPRRRTRRS